MKTGVYETIYGNAAAYYEGEDNALDMDMNKIIPTELVDFSKWIRKVD